MYSSNYNFHNNDRVELMLVPDDVALNNDRVELTLVPDDVELNNGRVELVLMPNMAYSMIPNDVESVNRNIFHSEVIARLILKKRNNYPSKGLCNNYVTLSCLYAKFRWLITRVKLSFQSLSLNVLRRRTDSLGGGGGTVVALRNY